MALQKTLSAETRSALDAVSQLTSAYFSEPTVKAYATVKTLIGELGSKLVENKVMIIAAEPSVFYSGKKRLCRALGMKLVGSDDIKAVLSMDYIPNSEQYEVICGFPENAKIFPSHDGLLSGFAVSSPTDQHIIYIPLDMSRLGVMLREDVSSYLHAVTGNYDSVDFGVVAIDEDPAQAEAYDSYTYTEEEPVRPAAPVEAPPAAEPEAEPETVISAPAAAAESETVPDDSTFSYIAAVPEISVLDIPEPEAPPAPADENPVIDFDNFVFETVQLDDDGNFEQVVPAEADRGGDASLAIRSVAPDMFDDSEGDEEKADEEDEYDDEDEDEEYDEDEDEEDYESDEYGDSDIIPVMIPDSISDEVLYPGNDDTDTADEFRINPDGTVGVPSAPPASSAEETEPDALEVLVANMAKALKANELTVALAPTGPFNAFGSIVGTDPEAGKCFIHINPSDFEEHTEGELYECCARNAGNAVKVGGGNLGVALTPIEPSENDGEFVICFAVADDKNADGAEIIGTDPTEMSRDCVTKLLEAIIKKAESFGADEEGTQEEDSEEPTVPAEVVKSRIPVIIGAAAVVLAIIISVVIAVLKSRGAEGGGGVPTQSAAALVPFAAKILSMYK